MASKGLSSSRSTPSPVDMQLVCAEGTTVDVSSTTLRRATFSEAIADVIGLLQQQHPNATSQSPIKWEVPQDKAAVWQVVWKMAKDPMSMAQAAGLTWDILAEVVQLVDKYALMHVMHKVHCWVLMNANTAPASGIPHLPTFEAALRVLQLRETLIKCGLAATDLLIEQVMRADLSLGAASGTTAHCNQCRVQRTYTLSTGNCTICGYHMAIAAPTVSVARMAMATAIQRYMQGGVGSWEAACKVMASVACMMAT